MHVAQSEGMSEPILRALGLAGIHPSPARNIADIPGFSHLGVAEPKAGVSDVPLSIWHAYHSHIPLTEQDAQRLLLGIEQSESNILISERFVPESVKEVLATIGVELWEREKISMLLGEAELEKISVGNVEELEGNRLPNLENDLVVSQKLELKRALGKIPFEGFTRPVLLEGKAWLASATLTSTEGKTMQSQAIMIENPWGDNFLRLEFEDLRSFQMEQIHWNGVWSNDQDVRTNIKEMLNKRISPTSPEVGKTSLLIWFRTLESTLKLDCKRVWLPGWILTDRETGTEYTIEGIGGSIAPFR